MKKAVTTSLFNFKNQVPTTAEWTKAFRLKNSLSPPRSTIANPLITEKAMAAIKLKNPSQMTALEIYPGLGYWTRALSDIGFKRILSLETQPHYNKWMQQSPIPQTEVIRKDGYNWETFIDLKTPEYLGPLENTDWSQVHQDIFFTGTLPKGSRGEQLLVQYCGCVLNKMALHTLGRIQMAFWVPDVLFKKFMAPPGNPMRCKMSVIKELCVDVDLIYSTEAADMYPSTEYHLISLVPFAENKLKSQWDVFEYVLKHLFVMQKRPLSHMVKTLGPGADIILGRLSFSPDILVGEMTAEQLDEVAIKFDQWPLRPRVLFEDANAY
ncbi:S-adenosyl-L-methionine-dependent methyltransferase [Backusella circina FSU 941]|nr:S-adenosyl-L-methionine-dependent methyltransferase [Backusella circina FSU 941]